MSGALSVKDLGKSYRQWGSEFQRIASWFVSSIAPQKEHWALKNVTFSVQPGEAVGVIGQNGAGKSTLLKLITGTVQPTQGSVRLSGRVSSILELGMGFNLELTGRQNVYHSSGLLGYHREDIERAISDIEAFAEIGVYFDQPMRTYSSGMQMRVAFSVATAFMPDLLIVDEILSVGDSYFQHKSADRIRNFRDAGISIILVTHNMADVRTLCDRVILLENGIVLKDGQPDEVVDYYNALISAREISNLSVEQRRERSGWLLTKSGTGEATVNSINMYDAFTGDEVIVAKVGQDLELKLNILIRKSISQLVLGLKICDKQGNVIWGTNTWHTKQIEKDLNENEFIDYNARFTCMLGAGSYSISTALVSTDTHLVNNYEWVDNMLVFEVINADRNYFIGSNCLDTEFTVIRGVVEIVQ